MDDCRASVARSTSAANVINSSPTPAYSATLVGASAGRWADTAARHIAAIVVPMPSRATCVAITDILRIVMPKVAGRRRNRSERRPNLLAERLHPHRGTSRVPALNAGVSGNRLLHDFIGTGALARLDRDVRVQTGVEYMIVLQGNADFLIPGLIGNPAEVVTADQVIQGHIQIIDRAHALELRIYGGTLSPVEGFPFPGAWSPEMELKRQAVVGSGSAGHTMRSLTSTRC